jgi:serine O-acetyltransferase
MQFKYLKYDLYRYFYPNNSISKISFFKKIRIILTTQGIWAICVYRLRRWNRYECNIYLLKVILKPICLFLYIFIQIITGISIGEYTDIGPGLYIGHFGCIFIGGTKIGKFFNISQGCTIGWAGRGEQWGMPTIGDFVYVAPGAKVIGKISIGNNVAIGANAVVTKDIAENCVVGGIPAKVINMNSSKDFILYNEKKNKEIL